MQTSWKCIHRLPHTIKYSFKGESIMTEMQQYVEDVLAIIQRRDPEQTEFQNAAREVLTSIVPMLEKEPKYKQHHILERIIEPERVIIFASSKLKVKEVTKALKQMKLNVGEMHSDLEQAQREEVMYEFKAGRINILVATDIVARGIDIDDIRLVINYDVPHDSEDYVHRIGRTARANNDGVAITFVSEKEQGNFKNIEKFLDRDIYKIPVPEELGEAPEYKPRAFDGGRRGSHGNGRKPGGNRNGRNNNKGGKPRAKRPQNGGEKK